MRIKLIKEANNIIIPNITNPTKLKFQHVEKQEMIDINHQKMVKPSMRPKVKADHIEPSELKEP